MAETINSHPTYQDSNYALRWDDGIDPGKVEYWDPSQAGFNADERWKGGLIVEDSSGAGSEGTEQPGDTDTNTNFSALDQTDDWHDAFSYPEDAAYTTNPETLSGSRSLEGDLGAVAAGSALGELSHEQAGYW